MICMETKNYGSVIEGLIANMPDVMMAVLDKGIIKSAHEAEDSKGFYVSHFLEPTISVLVIDNLLFENRSSTTSAVSRI